MEGGLLYIGRIFIELFFITLLSRFGKEWLYGSIIVNLLLITVLGSKMVSVFGFTMNSGNVFYAAILYAFVLLMEFHGKEIARRTIWQCAAFLVFALILIEFTISAGGTPVSREFDAAARMVFQFAPRVGLASILAFILSQHANIYFYDRLKKKVKALWLRNGATVVVTQTIDSLIFFPLAFVGVIPLETLLQILAVGFFAKLVVGFVSTPFLYFSFFLKKE